MTVKYQLSDDVAIVTLNRPDRFNSINAELSNDLVDALNKAGSEARAVVLTGEGKAFCAGADLSGFVDEYDKGGPDLGKHLDEEFHPVVHALSECAVPTVAAVNGAAAGAGMGLALGCDIRVMADSAYFTSAFTAIALAPDSGSTWLLPHHVGVSTALEMALTNRRMSAEEAVARGLAVESVGSDELIAKATEYATNLAGLATDALVTTRKLIRESGRLTFDEGLAREREEQTRLGKTPAHEEGVRAFLDKRKPDFKQF